MNTGSDTIAEEFDQVAWEREHPYPNGLDVPNVTMRGVRHQTATIYSFGGQFYLSCHTCLADFYPIDRRFALKIIGGERIEI